MPAIRVLAIRVLAAALLVPAWPLGGPTSATVWLWPLPPPHSVTRPFEAPASAYAAGHRGVDLSARPGAPVFASANGVVSFSGVVAGRPVLSISHAGDLVSSVEPVLGVVVEGDRVVAGQLVGRLASGGHCADACLHLGVRLHGQYVSPMLLLGGIPRAVLLPLSP
ncbi:M23 family metallopeptidase [Cryobacterium tagatosivorans]|uniref:M23 family metallopeptidase n=2 Tax=Cryobacterium tagatosivorans TaxID=1259199 RepID=A0A4R8UBS8_9MICO|nr:M23 family metallopeptidase [Cryobacterium tagatosivorans]